MRIYSLVWSTVSALAVLAGIALALTIESVPAMLGLFATVTICVAVIWANLRTLESGPARFATHARIAADSAAAGLTAVAAFGLGLTVGAWLLLVVAVLAVASPWTFDLVRHRARRGIRSDVTGESRLLDVRDGYLETWTDEELYSVWQATSTRLAEAAGEQATTAAQARHLLLAEIERRHPDETHAWLSSDAALNGEPPRFLQPPAN
ncbi:hypothetical protein [Kribbella sp. NPDC000426]|uniref:hypothetical protein n=1 Tax=Kribbella sp. NPDC000426 TaxID=3154255 RepID=UPI00331B8D39